MGLLDKLTGTKSPAAGVAPVPVDDLRAALLALNRDTAPWQVRDGAQENCDLVAEWRVVDAAWHSVFMEYGLKKMFRVKMRFDEAAHEVRNIDEQSTVKWRNGIPSVSASWSRGQQADVQFGRGAGFNEQGEFGEVYNYKFRTSEIKDPLRDAVNEHGWGWKAVSFKL
jgi:hypothetical protein